MGWSNWVQRVTRRPFWSIDAVRVDRLAPHRLHCVGVYSCNTNRWMSDLGDDYYTQRHSIVDIRTGVVTDGVERSLLKQEALDDDAFFSLVQRGAVALQSTGAFPLHARWHSRGSQALNSSQRRAV